MNLAAFSSAPAVYQVHALAALTSLVAGTTVIWMTKGTPRHLGFGRVFAIAMLVTAVTSFWIQTSGHFSPIHILSVITLVNIPLAIWARRFGNIRWHAGAMVGNYVGLLIAGAFALAPYRLMGKVFLGG
ncbi:MAG: DUF2306 domain-containing protein [Hyphomicrobiales bacterium]|nr:DUF2306 domain-containing protein [Hyphomicrobiales bacterium]MDE2114533.1 DUF2306 domain-containing protein [Hyphomicrobiales bacterium]